MDKPTKISIILFSCAVLVLVATAASVYRSSKHVITSNVVQKVESSIERYNRMKNSGVFETVGTSAYSAQVSYQTEIDSFRRALAEKTEMKNRLEQDKLAIQKINTIKIQSTELREYHLNTVIRHIQTGVLVTGPLRSSEFVLTIRSYLVDIFGIGEKQLTAIHDFQQLSSLLASEIIDERGLRGKFSESDDIIRKTTIRLDAPIEYNIGVLAELKAKNNRKLVEKKILEENEFLFQHRPADLLRYVDERLRVLFPENLSYYKEIHRKQILEGIKNNE